MPDITDDILFAPLAEQAALIKERKLSPVELANACIGRLEKYGEKLGAVVTITRELALKQAKAAEEEIRAGRYRGPLHGIPYGSKDLLATKDIPTTWGAEPFRKQVFDHDATVIKKLNDAGAVLVAKLAMVELAGGFNYGTADASFTGAGRTPWNRDYWSGGSSSGSAAAVAAGLVSFAIGSETSGSIITPATFCGVTGLRPTYGRVSRHGAMALCWTLDKLGPIARSVDCCGHVLRAIAGRDPLDPSSVERPFEHPEVRDKEKKFRVGVLKNIGGQKEVVDNFKQSLKVLEDYCELVEGVELPKLPFGAVVGTIVGAEGASAFRDLLDSGKAKELKAPNCKWSGYSGLLIPAVDYIQAMRLRGLMKRVMKKLYAEFDAIVCPSLPTVAYPVGVEFAKAWPDAPRGNFTEIIPAGNAVGQPAIALPNGFGEKGLPTGISFTGKAWSESRLLAIASEYQRATEWHKKRPVV